MPENYVSQIELDRGSIKEIYDIQDVTARGYLPIEGTGAPKPNTPAIIGQTYINTTSKEEWTCVGIESDSRIWERHSAGKTNLQLDSIEIAVQPTKTAYNVGEIFSPVGMSVTANYQIDGLRVISGVEVSAWSYDKTPITRGTNSIRISYSEGGIIKYAYQPITTEVRKVTRPTVNGLDQTLYSKQVQYGPTYYSPDTAYFHTEGDIRATIPGTYSFRFVLNDPETSEWDDGTSEDITYSWILRKGNTDIESIIPSEIQVSTDEKTCSFQVRVSGDNDISFSLNPTGKVNVEYLGKSIVSGRTTYSFTATMIDGVESGNVTLAIYSYESDYFLDNTFNVNIGIDAKNRNGIYGVSDNNGVSSSTLSRTDDALYFPDPQPEQFRSIPKISGSSPFDDIYPWSEIKVINDPVAGELVEVPIFWYKIAAGTGTLKIQITGNQEIALKNGFAVSPGHNWRVGGSGDGMRQYFYVGRHKTNASKKSQNNTPMKTYTTIESAMSDLHSLGDDYYLMDFCAWYSIWLLYIVEFAEWDPQFAIGWASNRYDMPFNYDSQGFSYHTGCTNIKVFSDHVLYRGIEDLWSAGYEWLSGCFFSKNMTFYANNKCKVIHEDPTNRFTNPIYTFEQLLGTVDTYMGTPYNKRVKSFKVVSRSGLDFLCPSSYYATDAGTIGAEYWQIPSTLPTTANRDVYVGGYDPTYGSSEDTNKESGFYSLRMKPFDSGNTTVPPQACGGRIMKLGPLFTG